MKIVIINGSARKGNTLAAINAFIKGASEKNKIEIIEPDKLNIAPCKGCGVCQCSKGCVDKDDTNSTIDKIAAADMILFATPVYWWGMSAQLKLIIDKCYCRGLQLKNKKVGTIVVGGSPVGSIQYELIDKQFDCMAKYLSWDMLFKKSYYATARDELEKNKDSMNELEWNWKKFIKHTPNSSLPTCPLREEKSFSQRAFSIYTDIRKLQDKAKTSYTLSTRRLRFGYE